MHRKRPKLSKTYAIVKHQKRSGGGRHWVYIKDHQQNQWWKHNDKRVTMVSNSEVLRKKREAFFLSYAHEDNVRDFTRTILLE